MFGKQAFGAAVPGVDISPAFTSMTFGASQATGASASGAAPAPGVYDSDRQITVDNGTPVALAAAERTPWETREDSQTWTDREA